MEGLRNTTNIFVRVGCQCIENRTLHFPNKKHKFRYICILATSSSIPPETLTKVENAGKENDNDLLQSTSESDVFEKKTAAVGRFSSVYFGFPLSVIIPLLSQTHISFVCYRLQLFASLNKQSLSPLKGIQFAS
jgi:hypothetical protein